MTEYCNSQSRNISDEQNGKYLIKIIFILKFQLISDFLYILGDPGADSGGKGKSKQAVKVAQRKVILRAIVFFFFFV